MVVVVVVVGGFNPFLTLRMDHWPHFHFEVPIRWALGALRNSTSNMVSQ